MGEVRHLPFELLSALHDGELRDPEAALARAHLAACVSCRAVAAPLARLKQSLEQELRLPPALSCAEAAPFLSALQDGEADTFDTDIASRHLGACEGCRVAGSAWTALEVALAVPQALPGVRVDHAMAALTGRGRASRRSGPTTVGPLGGVAWRGAVVAVLGFAIAFGSTLAPQRPGDQAEPVATGPQDHSLVASVQQVVLHAATNTLYVAQPEEGSVNALDATTYEVRARIAVGGRPTALVLNDEADRIMVLDAGAKRLTEIDPHRNTVVAATQLELTGTPTSVQIDNGKIVVSTVVAAQAPTASAAATAASGQVAVFNSATKALETVRAVDVAPRLVVPDPRGQRTLLVSAEATTVADASYRTIETIAGGIGAAFGQADRIAVLSAEGDDARLTFYGNAAPAAIRLAGKAAAVVGLPDGGFAVLVDVRGAGRIIIVDAKGHETGAADVAMSGRDLAYDAAARRFTVVGRGQAVSAALPAPVAAGPVLSPATPRASDSASPSPSSAPAASPSPSTAPVGSPSPSIAPSAPSQAVVAGVPVGAVQVSGSLYRLPLDGRMPVLVASTPTRIWFTDQRNQLSTLDTASGAVFTVAQLPRDAVLHALAAGPTHVFAFDAARARLYQVGVGDERLSSHTLPAVDLSAMIVAPDGTVWAAIAGSSHLLNFDPVTKRVELVDVGVRNIVTLAAERGGRLWFSNGVAVVGWYDARTRRAAHLEWWGGAAPTVLLADASGQIWAGTATGDVLFLRDGAANLVIRTGRPVTGLTLDPAGRAWLLAPADGAIGLVYRPVDGSQGARLVPGPAISLSFSPTGRAWLADASGGFYLGTTGSP